VHLATSKFANNYTAHCSQLTYNFGLGVTDELPVCGI